MLAFGDSITEGKPGSLLNVFEFSGVGCGTFGTPTSYPSVLNSRFVAQYPTQTLSARNCGWGGEEAVEGVTRLPTGLATGNTWQALGGAPDPYVDFDGLHLTVAGYAKVADAFFTALRTKLETRVSQ